MDKVKEKLTKCMLRYRANIIHRNTVDLEKLIIEIENCTTNVFCPEVYEGDEPCPECRTKQLVSLMGDRVGQEKDKFDLMKTYYQGELLLLRETHGEEIERLFEEIENTFPFIRQGVNEEPWQSLKSKYLGDK